MKIKIRKGIDGRWWVIPPVGAAHDYTSSARTWDLARAQSRWLLQHLGTA